MIWIWYFDLFRLILGKLAWQINIYNFNNSLVFYRVIMWYWSSFSLIFVTGIFFKQTQINQILNDLCGSILPVKAFFVYTYMDVFFLEGCIDGFFGEGCRNSCQYPSYGKDCQKMCECAESVCNLTTGCETYKRMLLTIRISIFLKFNKNIVQDTKNINGQKNIS